MDNFLEITRWVHAGFGVICIISGLLALTAKKTIGRHPVAGRVFAVSLILVYLTILANILFDLNVFMLGIGWLAVYAAAIGWRALLRFKGRLVEQATLTDYILGSTTALFSVSLFAFGILVFATSSNVMGLVCSGFGLLGVLLVHADWKRWRIPPKKEAWLALHIDMMTGAFSAALTAFLVIQFSEALGGLEWIVWVAPVIVMSRYAAHAKSKHL